jgi:hypothetical protein
MVAGLRAAGRWACSWIENQKRVLLLETLNCHLSLTVDLPLSPLASLPSPSHLDGYSWFHTIHSMSCLFMQEARQFPRINQTPQQGQGKEDEKEEKGWRTVAGDRRQKAMASTTSCRKGRGRTH